MGREAGDPGAALPIDVDLEDPICSAKVAPGVIPPLLAGEFRGGVEQQVNALVLELGA